MKQSEIRKTALAALEPFEGRTVKSLSEEEQATVKSILQTAKDKGARVLVQEYQSGAKCYVIDLTGLRETITLYEEREHALETLEGLDSYKRYTAALEQLKESWEDMKEDARKAGLGRGWMRVIDTVSVNPAARVTH